MIIPAGLQAPTGTPAVAGHSVCAGPPTTSIFISRARLLPAKARAPEQAPATPNGLEEPQVQTRFLRLCQPAGLGDRIDGWRVCWVGGWDKSKVLFVVMVERVVRAAQT